MSAYDAFVLTGLVAQLPAAEVDKIFNAKIPAEPDFHRRVAARVLGVRYADVSAEQREAAKRGLFVYLYKGKAHGRGAK